MRECTKCKVLKSLENYNKYAHKNYLKAICKECEVQRAQTWNSDNKEKLKRSSRNSSFKRKYDITLDQYEDIAKSQNNKCLICEEETKRNLAVDHCHETGKIRGLLCMNCNIGLGHFKDDIINLRKAISYLENQDTRLQLYHHLLKSE